MKIEKISLENWKALQGEHSFAPNGCSFFLVGGNNKGKSSVGKLLYQLISQKYPSRLISEGEKEGYAEITINDGHVIHAGLSEGKKPVLTLISPEGQKIDPKKIFSGWYSDAWSFDIDKFLSSQPKVQREMLEKIVGLDFSMINDMEKELEEKRTIANRDLKSQKAIVKPFDHQLAQLEPKKASDLIEKIREKQGQLDSYNYQVNKVNSLKDQIQQLELALKKAESDLATMEEVNEFEIIDMDVELQEIEVKNKAIEEARKYAAEQMKLEHFETIAKDLDDQIKDIRKMKDDMIKSNPLPADGLEFDQEGKGLLLNGLPFEDNQISTSAKAIAALQIAEAQLGEIRYLHFSAESLDKENTMRVAEWAESRGLQLAIERPLWEGGELKMEVIDNTVG